MKKIILFIVSFILLFVPSVTSALTFAEIPPVVVVEGGNIDEYDVDKKIEDEKVIVTLKHKISHASYSWSFDRNQVGDILTLNFELDFDSPLEQEIDEKSVENTDKMYLSFHHHGELPSEATIRVDVSQKYENGTKLYLYYYNEEKKQIEYIDHNLEVKDGYVEFQIDHCSEYFLTTAIVNDAANNPKSMNTIIIILVGVIVVLVGATMFQTKR